MSQAIVGQIIFFFGMIVGIISSAKLPADGASWPDTMTSFMGAVLMCIVGLFIWRRAPKNLGGTGGVGGAGTS